MNNGQTHFDPVENNAICHSACAIAEIKRLRDAGLKLAAELAVLKVMPVASDAATPEVREAHPQPHATTGTPPAPDAPADALIARLNAIDYTAPHDDLCHDAAAALAAMQKRIAMQAGELIAANSNTHRWECRAEKAEAALAALTAERDDFWVEYRKRCDVETKAALERAAAAEAALVEQERTGSDWLRQRDLAEAALAERDALIRSIAYRTEGAQGVVEKAINAECHAAIVSAKEKPTNG